jgi:hypothetical protein
MAVDVCRPASGVVLDRELECSNLNSPRPVYGGNIDGHRGRTTAGGVNRRRIVGYIQSFHLNQISGKAAVITTISNA